MPILKYTTAVPVSQTVGEIQQLLGRRGVTRISTAFDGDGQPIGLGFEMTTDYGIRSYEMPVRIAGVFEALTRDSDVPKAKRTLEQAARVAWRIALGHLESVAALIDADMTTLDEVLLPYLVDGRGRTMYELTRASLGQIEA